MLIVLETNLLYGRADPDASGIKPLLTLAAQVGAAVKIAEPCLIELRDGQRQNIQTAKAELQKARRLLIGVIPTIDEAVELAAYDERLQRFLKTHGITTIPFVDSLAGPKALFEAAVKKQSPFDGTGNNFRDAVICLSVSQFARRVPSPVLLVTNDVGFLKMVLDGTEGFEVISPTDAIKRLESELSQTDRTRRTELRNRITFALRQRFEEIQQIAARDIDFPRADGVKIHRFDAEEVESVEPEDLLGSKVAFAAEIDGQLYFTVGNRPAPYSFAAETPGPGWWALVPPKTEPPGLISSPATLRVEGQALLDADGNLETIEFASIAYEGSRAIIRGKQS